MDAGCMDFDLDQFPFRQEPYFDAVALFIKPNT